MCKFISAPWNYLVIYLELVKHDFELKCPLQGMLRKKRCWTEQKLQKVSQYYLHRFYEKPLSFRSLCLLFLSSILALMIDSYFYRQYWQWWFQNPQWESIFAWRITCPSAELLLSEFQSVALSQAPSIWSLPSFTRVSFSRNSSSSLLPVRKPYPDYPYLSSSLQ